MRKVICDTRDGDGLISPIKQLSLSGTRLFRPAAEALINFGVSPNAIQAVIDETVASAVYHAKVWLEDHGFEVTETN